MTTDVELATVEIRHISGYPSLASFIASDKDKSTVIYRRFDRLSARNILYLQSELAELEARQDEYDREDVKGSMVDKQCARNWNEFRERARDTERQKDRLELVKEIRRVMKEYKEAIVLDSTLLSIEKPSSRTLTAFRNVFHNVHVSGIDGAYPTLGGHSSQIYDDADDLMVLKSQLEEDRLTRFLRYYFAILFTVKRTDSPLVYFSEGRLRLVVALINLILAAVLLFGAIYNLYWVSSDGKKLGLIAGYTVAFAACIGFATNAKRSEVFAGCAAYAAVLVVFVSGNLGTPAGTGTSSSV
ncbi:chorismate mutase protein [Rutstroemia sp. NJR-2017a WRK4]|nr:chorismate mutase protein [Rutstroemia sp. NJR-2017a WRK4]